MRHYAILRLLFAGFLLYFAWPAIPSATTTIELIFWGGWLGFFLLVFGSNLATLLQMMRPLVMEQKELMKRQPANR